MKITFTVQLTEQQVEEIVDARGDHYRDVAISIKSNRILAPPRSHEKLAPRWLNVNDASRYCGLSVRTINRIVKAGHVASYARGRRLIDRWSLDDWIQGDSEKRPQKRQREIPRLNEVDIETIAEAVVRLLGNRQVQP
jgi:hypothetical protein